SRLKTLTLPLLRNGSLPLPFHGRGAEENFISVYCPSPACGRGRGPAEGWEGEGPHSLLICRFMIFPFALRGRGSFRNSIRIGTLKAARRAPTCVFNSASVTLMPGLT